MGTYNPMEDAEIVLTIFANFIRFYSHWENTLSQTKDVSIRSKSINKGEKEKKPSQCIPHIAG